MILRCAGVTARYAGVIARCAGIVARCAGMVPRYRRMTPACRARPPWCEKGLLCAPSTPPTVPCSRRAVPRNHPSAPWNRRRVPQNDPENRTDGARLRMRGRTVSVHRPTMPCRHSAVSPKPPTMSGTPAEVHDSFAGDSVVPACGLSTDATFTPASQISLGIHMRALRRGGQGCAP
jgi:hypothetical protein